MSKLISFSNIISTFGASAKSKLSNIAIDGAPEDQLRAPLEHLTAGFAKLCGFADGAVVMVGEFFSRRTEDATGLRRFREKRLSRLRGGKGTRQGV